MTFNPNQMRNRTIARNRSYLERDISLKREDVERAKAALREVQVTRDEFELRNRPSYPTTGQLLALEKAVEDIKDRHAPASHLGREISDGVWSHGKDRFIFIDVKAPYAEASNGRLWALTNAEVGEILAHVKSLGIGVNDWWHHEKGISIRTNLP